MNPKAISYFLALLSVALAQEIDYDDLYGHHRPDYYEQREQQQQDQYYEREQQQQDQYYEQQQQDQYYEREQRQPTAAELQQHQASARPQCGPCEKEQCSSPMDCLAGKVEAASIKPFFGTVNLCFNSTVNSSE